MEGKVFMKNTAFTMLELIVILVIMGVLAIFYIPSMKDPLERSRGKNAEFNLLSIYAAQKRYLLSERAYYVCDDAIALPDRVYNINQNLSIKIDDPYFDYDIDGVNGYRARAIRKDGKCKNQQMNLTADNSTVDKRGCSAW